MNKENYRLASILAVFSNVSSHLWPNNSWSISNTFLMIRCETREKCRACTCKTY